MNLAADIGNTHTKIALFEREELKHVFTDENTIDKVLSSYKIEKAVISKTGKNEKVDLWLKEKNIPTLLLNNTLNLPIKILYKSPETLGADRIAGSVAANLLFPKNNVLKIDFGTCITYDFVNDKGEYLGGSISPGVRIRFRALNQFTAKLPLIDAPGEGANSFELTGNDTNTAILSGVMNGIKEEARGIIKEYDSRFGSLKVVATGGDLHFFAALLKSEIFARPYLVLEGLNAILNYNA